MILNFGYAHAQSPSDQGIFRAWGQLYIVDNDVTRPATGARVELFPDGQAIVLEKGAVVDGKSRWQIFSDPIMNFANELSFQMKASHPLFPNYVVVDKESLQIIEPQKLLNDGQVLVSFGSVHLRSRSNAAAYMRDYCDGHQPDNEDCYASTLEYEEHFDLFQAIATIQENDGRYSACADTYDAAVIWTLEKQESTRFGKTIEFEKLQDQKEAAARNYITCLLRSAKKRQKNQSDEEDFRLPISEWKKEFWYVAIESQRMMRLEIRPNARNAHRANIISAWLEALHHMTSNGPSWDKDLATAILKDSTLRENFEALYFQFIAGCHQEYKHDIDTIVSMIKGIKRTVGGEGRRVCEPKES